MKYVSQIIQNHGNYPGKGAVCAKQLSKQLPKSPFAFATPQLYEGLDQSGNPLQTIPWTPWFCQGAICQVWDSQSGVHWRHSEGVSFADFVILI